MSTPRLLPLPITLAPLAPAAVLAIVHALRIVGGPPVSANVVVWACVTAPVALLWLGLRRLAAAPGGVAEEEVRRAIAVVAEAERAVERMAALVAGPANTPRPRVKHAPIAAVLLFVGLLLAGATTLAVAMWQGPDDEPVHIHAGFAIVRESERLRFQDEAHDYATRGILRAHIHVPDDGTLHIEGPPGETLAAALDHAVGFTLPSDARVYVLANGSEAWRDALLRGILVPKDGDRILVVVGPLSPEALVEAQRAVPMPFARAMQ